MSELVMVLAQTTQPSDPYAFLRTFVPLILVIVVFMWITSRGRSKERKRFEEMLASLKKGDRVQTIGGILGVVVDARDNEVVVKVDESNNVKIRFHRSAIKEVQREPEAT